MIKYQNKTFTDLNAQTAAHMASVKKTCSVSDSKEWIRPDMRSFLMLSPPHTAQWSG